MRMILSTTAILLATGPALAGGMTPAPAPTPVQTTMPGPAYDFSGVSLGAQLGYGDVEADLDLPGSAPDGDGALYGLRAYYDYTFGNGLILGGGIQYDFSDIDVEGDAVPGTTELDDILRIGPRLGFQSNRNWYYLTAGYARAGLDNDTIDFDETGDGYFVGLGYEVFLTDAVTAGAEVLYHQLDGYDDVDELEVDATTATLSVNYRF